MSEENIVEGPPLERILNDTNLGELTLMMLQTQADTVVQVSFYLLNLQTVRF